MSSAEYKVSPGEVAATANYEEYELSSMGCPPDTTPADEVDEMAHELIQYMAEEHDDEISQEYLEKL